jgi:hypothetical protein
VFDGVKGAAHESLDETFWKPLMLRSIQCAIPMPYAVMVETAKGYKQVGKLWFLHRNAVIMCVLKASYQWIMGRLCS